VDSQNLAGDTFVGLALAARQTSTLLALARDERIAPFAHSRVVGPSL
jgi:hypothetical protein